MRQANHAPGPPANRAAEGTVSGSVGGEDDRQPVALHLAHRGGGAPDAQVEGQLLAGRLEPRREVTVVVGTTPYQLSSPTTVQPTVVAFCAVDAARPLMPELLKTST